MPSIYKLNYPGAETMQRHDEADALRRWCADWGPNKVDRYFTEFDWITIEAKTFTVRGRKRVRYVGTVGSDLSEFRRTVAFEVGAPPPPTFFRPAPVRPSKADRRLYKDLSGAVDSTLTFEKVKAIYAQLAPPPERFVVEFLRPPTIERLPPSGPPIWKGIDTVVLDPRGGIVNWDLVGGKPPAKPVLPPPPRYRRN